MGTYGTGILQNDTSGEVYERFYELLEEKKEIIEIVKVINEEFIAYKNHDHSKTDFLFALGLALWENCRLDEKTLSKITEYANNGIDINIWKELEGSEEDIVSRTKELKKFLAKISKPRKKALVRKKKVIAYKPPIFKIGDCLTYKISNGNYSGVIVVREIKNDSRDMGGNVIISTDINQAEKPTKQDFINANILILNFGDYKNWVEISDYSSETFNDLDFEIEIIDKIEINPKISDYFKNNFCGCGNWESLAYNIENELIRKPVRRKVKELSIKDVLIDLKLKETKNKF